MIEVFKAEKYSSYEPEGVELPKIDLDDKLLRGLKLKSGASSLDVLKALAREGIKARGIDKLPNKDIYYVRAKQEIDTFEELGFVDYILLNWDIWTNFAQNNGIIIGDGRGSAAGSLVLYLLKVTNVDPIKNGLYFERFVSKSRAKKIQGKDGKTYLDGSLLPDVDTDCCILSRSRVIEYIQNKHKGKVSKIATITTLSSKLALRESVKFFTDGSEEDANYVSDMVEKNHGIVADIKDGLDNPKFKEWADNNKLAYLAARKLENLNKNFGVHASGIAISSQKIEDIIPIQKTKDGELVSGYDMKDVGDLTVKFDVLGLRTLSVAERTCKKIGIQFADIDVHDPFIYQQYQDFKHPEGLFQISADTNFKVTQDVKPINLNRLSDVVAIARPGALSFLKEYVKNQNSGVEGEKRHPVLDNILGSTMNVILYQEQLMQIANQVFGLSLEDAETLRRVIGKKLVHEMPKWEKIIYDQAEKLGLNKTIADFYWKVLDDSKNYSFNLSHSMAYAQLAAKTTYLKFKYPKEFFLSVLEMAEYEADPLGAISIISKELSDFNIELLPPSLEQSKMEFSIQGGNIRYGLNAIKGISEKTLEPLKKFIDLRKEDANKFDVFAAAQSAKLNIGVLSSIIQAGALSNASGVSRSRLVLEAQTFNLLTEKERREFYNLGPRYHYDLLEIISKSQSDSLCGSDGKVIMKPSRFETFKKKFAPLKDIYLENKKHEKLCNWWFEYSLLGYVYSSPLHEAFDIKYGKIHSGKEIQNEAAKTTVKFAGKVKSVNTKKSKNDNKYLQISLDDGTFEVTGLLIDSKKDKKYTKFLEEGRQIPKKDDICVIVGQKSDSGSLFLDSIFIVPTKIYMKIREFNNKND